MYSNRDSKGRRMSSTQNPSLNDHFCMILVEFVRFACDLMNFYFLFDEYTDVAEVSVVKGLANTVISVLENPEAKSDNPHVVGEMIRQKGVTLSTIHSFDAIPSHLHSIWKQANILATPGCPCLYRFFKTTVAYVNSVVQEAEDRMLNQVRPVEDYFRLRRDTAATPTTIGLQEIGLDIPNEVYFHLVLVSLTQDAEDILPV